MWTLQKLVVTARDMLLPHTRERVKERDHSSALFGLDTFLSLFSSPILSMINEYSSVFIRKLAA
jgi:hypothetical protein